MDASTIPLRRAARRCVVLGCILGATLAGVVGSDVVMCSRELRLVPEPAGWRAWPIVPTLGEYHVDGKRGACVGHGLLCATEDAALVAKGVCPRAGLPLDAWFNKGGIYASSADISLRRSPDGIFVASAYSAQSQAGSTEPPPNGGEFLGAFRSIAGISRPGLVHVEALVSANLLALALLGMILASVDARRQAALAAAYADPSRFKPAARNASNAIVFEDHSLPQIAAGSDGNAKTDRLPGPVLVRVASVTDGSYRQPPSARAREIIDGDAATLSLAATARAKSSLGLGFAGAVFLFVLMLCVQACTALSAIRID